MEEQEESLVTVGRKPRCCWSQFDFVDKFELKKIPSEMEVAPRYNCLYTVDTVNTVNTLDTVDTDDTVYTIYNVNTVYTADIVYTVNTVSTVGMV